MNVFYAKSVLFCDRIVAVLRVPSQRGKGRCQPYPGGDGIVALLRVPSQRCPNNNGADQKAAPLLLDISRGEGDI